MKIIIQFIIIHSTVRLSLSAFLPFHSIYYEIFFKAKTSNYYADLANFIKNSTYLRSIFIRKMILCFSG